MQVADPRALDRRDMDEDVLRSVLGLDEAVTLLRVEPFDDADGHAASSSIEPPRGCAGRTSLGGETGSPGSAERGRAGQGRTSLTAPAQNLARPATSAE